VGARGCPTFVLPTAKVGARGCPTFVLPTARVGARGCPTFVLPTSRVGARECSTFALLQPGWGQETANICPFAARVGARGWPHLPSCSQSRGKRIPYMYWSVDHVWERLPLHLMMSNMRLFAKVFTDIFY